MRLSKTLHEWRNPANGDEWLMFFCPACDCPHNVKVRGAGAWGWNGDVERPTFTESILVTWPANPEAADEFKEWRKERRCHSFVTDGLIQFLVDSTHDLAGRSVQLAAWPEGCGQ